MKTEHNEPPRKAKGADLTDAAGICQARQRVELAYDPQLLRDAGRRMVDLLCDHLAKAEASQGPVLPWHEPAENVRLAAAALQEATGSTAGREALADHFSRLVETMLDHGQNLHDPRYLGHQVASSVPLAGLFDAVGSVSNQAMAIYEMGPWATAVEWAMVQQLGARIGWQPGEFAGLATHGGSLANLTALLTARNVTLGDCWRQGVARSDLPPVIVAHADAHYSVVRAAGILGLGTNQVLRVGLDARRRMDVEALDRLLRDLRAKQQPVVAVVACACSTLVGAFDRLDEVAEVCQRHGVWLHVDAAHGGAACLSPRYRHLVDGLHRADSVTWDAHKMLFVPALCAFVFYRKAAHVFEAFRQDAPYLFDPAAPGLAEFDSGLRTVECTKRAAVFGLWGIWSLFGEQLFADLVDITFTMGQVFHEKLSLAPDFVALHEPQCNIVAFRYVPESLRDAPAEVLGRLQLETRRRIVESGEYYIVSTKLDGIGAMRVTIINPLTTPAHLDDLLDTIRRAAAPLIAAMQ
jgi:L-2,4-diaminobutyrate decarboxylase